MNLLYAALLEKIIALAQETPNISCLAQIGSQTSSQNLNDEYSDLDVLLVVKDLSKVFSQAAWLDLIGEVWITFTESAPTANYYERRVIFAGGLDVDFVLIEEAILLEDIKRLPIAGEICRENVVVLVDKGQIGSSLSKLKIGKKPFAFPAQAEFNNLVNDFYFHYLWAFKKLRRGEHWVALRCINTYLKARLLSMLEWYEHAIHGNEYPTFYEGRFLERWLEPELTAELSGLFSRYNPDEMEPALIQTMEFFTKIAKDTATKNQFSFPEEGRQKLAAWVEENYFQRKQLSTPVEPALLSIKDCHTDDGINH